MMVEGEEYNITCEIPKIAPVQNLTVKWYNGDRIIESDVLEIIEPNNLKNTKQPVKLLSTFPFTPTRNDSGARFRCEAQMDLSPVGPHLNVSSQELTITVVCKFELICLYIHIKYNSVSDSICDYYVYLARWYMSERRIKHYIVTNGWCFCFFSVGPDVQCSNLIELMENESLEENCNIEGNPTPSVKWLKDGQLFNSTTPMRRENAGMYTLEANGSLSVQKNIQVHVLCECHIHFYDKLTKVILHLNIIHLKIAEIAGCTKWKKCSSPN